MDLQLTLDQKIELLKLASGDIDLYRKFVEAIMDK